MIQKFEEDVAGHGVVQLFALCTKALTNSPQPAVHAACQIQKLCQKLCKGQAGQAGQVGQAGQAGQAGQEMFFPGTFATPCSDQHSVGKLPPRSSWAHLQATACSCSSQAVPSIHSQACSKIYMASLPIHLLTPAKKELGRKEVCTTTDTWICVFCLSTTGTSKSHNMFLFQTTRDRQQTVRLYLFETSTLKTSQEGMDTSASKIFKDLQLSQHRISRARKYRMARNERIEPTGTDPFSRKKA